MGRGTYHALGTDGDWLVSCGTSICTAPRLLGVVEAQGSNMEDRKIANECSRHREVVGGDESFEVTDRHKEVGTGEKKKLTFYCF